MTSKKVWILSGIEMSIYAEIYGKRYESYEEAEKAASKLVNNGDYNDVYIYELVAHVEPQSAPAVVTKVV